MVKARIGSRGEKSDKARKKRGAATTATTMASMMIQIAGESKTNFTMSPKFGTGFERGEGSNH
jgi:hypothetical protein